MSSEIMFGGGLLSLSFPVIQIKLQENKLLPFTEGRRKVLVKALAPLYECFMRWKKKETFLFDKGIKSIRCRAQGPCQPVRRVQMWKGEQASGKQLEVCFMGGEINL